MKSQRVIVCPKCKNQILLTLEILDDLVLSSVGEEEESSKQLVK